MSNPHRHFTIPARRVLYGLLAVVTAVCLLLLPMGMNAMVCSPACEDTSAPTPVNEEELRHAEALLLFSPAHVAPVPGRGPLPPLHPDDATLRGDHGEVPHPPPWA